MNTPEPAPAMNNQYNQRPGYPYAPYNYGYPPYTPMGPYPTTPYGIPSPMPMGPIPNYAYYPQMLAQQDQPTYVTNPPIYAPSIPYAQTRMATPSPYQPVTYPPQTPQPPGSYNYNTTNLISRPTRPASIYPQLNQMPRYVAPPNNAQTNQLNNNNNSIKTPVVKNEPSRESVESNTSKKSDGVCHILNLTLLHDGRDGARRGWYYSHSHSQPLASPRPACRARVKIFTSTKNINVNMFIRKPEKHHT